MIEDYCAAAAELRRLHAQNTEQRAELVAEAARTANEKLRADQMTKQHRIQCDISKSAVATLVGLGYTDRGGEQWAPPIGKAPDFNLLDAAHARIADLEAQLSAIGAGGVEALRKPSTVDSESQYATTEESASVMRSTPETAAEKRVNQMIEDRWLNEQGVAPEAYTRGLFDIAAELAANMQAAQPSRERLLQSAVDEAVTLLHKYKGLCVAAGRGDGFHLKRIEDAAAALQAAPPAENLRCKSVQKRLTTQWGYVPAQEHATQLAGQGQAIPQGFLADAMTAAGLVAHGKQCKALGERLAEGVMVIRAAAHAQAQGCTRSHPHENMSPMCVLRTEIARLNHAAAIAQATAAPAQAQEDARAVELGSVLTRSFLTAQSDGSSSDYKLVAKFKTLAELHQAHRAAIASIDAARAAQGGAA